MQLPKILQKKAFLLILAFELGLGVGAILLGFLLKSPPFTTLNWSPAAFFWGMIASLPALAIFIVCYCWPLGPLATIRTFLIETVYPLFRDFTVLNLALISLAAGLGEELLFRGLLQNLLSGWLGSTAGWCIASLLFGLAHWITPTYAIIATFIGFFLGWLWISTGNLCTPIVTHALYDFIALLIFLKWFPPIDS